MDQPFLMQSSNDEQFFSQRARTIRRTIIEIIYRAKTSHIGCSLSCADILTALYFKILNLDPVHPDANDRDRFILSKGHAVTALYASLAERGFFQKNELLDMGADGTMLASHVVRGVLPGIEVSAGSGGHGLSIGVGMSLALRHTHTSARVFVLSGDGEMQEGSMWEAILFAGFHKLNNLTLIVDKNNFQEGTDGLRVNEIADLHPLDKKLQAFNWDVDSVNGHDVNDLINALQKKTSKPHAIIANTKKGMGISFMEDQGMWHGKCPNEEEYRAALNELS